MLVRRPLPCILILAAALHAVGMSRSPLPAQDGLKFIRFARAFHTQPWADAVRSSDQHPLYPMLVACVQPLVAVFRESEPDSWRMSAQVVSIGASLLLLAILYDWAKHLTSRRTAVWACLIWLALPVPARLGHDTLSDNLALAATLGALTLGVRWLDVGGRKSAIGSGVVAGFGYLARPEVALVPIVLLLMALARHLLIERLRSAPATAGGRPVFPRLAEAWLGFLVLVGCYTLVKGEVSEKLSIRTSAGLGPSAISGIERTAEQLAPAAFRGAGWDFSPKEEWGDATSLSGLEAGRRFFQALGESLGWLGGGLAALGLVWGRCRSVGRTASRLAAIYGVVFAAVVVRHAMGSGYLSERHVLPIVILCLPRAAMGLRESLVRIGSWRKWSWSRRRLGRLATVASLLAVALTIQLKPTHASRWGHLAAARWLTAHAEPGEAVLDTRGWAAFHSGLPAYDYWHVRQALTDSNLSYLVVTLDELEAASPRAATLRSIIKRAGQLAVAYPERLGGLDASIRVYRFNPLRVGSGERP